MADVSWEKVEQQLWEDLGQAFTNIQQRVVIALAVFCLESGCRHEENILDYFLLAPLLTTNSSCPRQRFSPLT